MYRRYHILSPGTVPRAYTYILYIPTYLPTDRHTYLHTCIPIARRLRHVLAPRERSV